MPGFACKSGFCKLVNYKLKLDLHANRGTQNDSVVKVTNSFGQVCLDRNQITGLIETTNAKEPGIKLYAN